MSKISGFDINGFENMVDFDLYVDNALKYLKIPGNFRGILRVNIQYFPDGPEQLELDFDEGPEVCDGPEFDGWSERSGKDNEPL